MPPRSSTDLEVHVLTRTEQLQELVPQWEALARACGATVFHSPAWSLAWWQAFGSSGHLRVFTVRSGGHLLGLAAFCLEASRARVRRLKTLGSPQADYGGVLALPGTEQALGHALAERLYADPSWDVLWLAEVPEECRASRSLVEALGARGCRVQQRSGWCHRIPLPGSWEEYLGLLGRATRKRLLQKARRLVELGAEAQPVRGVGGMEAFIALHTAQWVRRGQRGAFADGPSARFHVALAGALERLGHLDAWFLTLDGTPQAAVYDLRFGRSVYSYLSAVNPDGLLHLSPGMVLTLWRIRAAIQDGYAWYDLLRGDEAYKRTLGARPYRNTTYLVAHRGRWRAWWYLALEPLREILLRRERASRGQTAGALPPREAPGGPEAGG
jgi:CelD/BcsL family acetyltransferase involved in cellulose biosynthesis